MTLTLSEADQVIEGAFAKARQLGIRVSVAISDAGGHLLAFKRMDGASWASVYGSQGKAVAAVGFRRPSGELQERADSPIFRGIAAAHGGRMILSIGAVPILRDGIAIGACGVGGGTGQEDEECARAGVAVLGA
ncbi:MAG: heme-binding protein [Alphaproteobacteria bacterium]